ncbi:hypothetical protein SAMN05421788_101712 [Filimonas lacunae]|uniref:Uncharacterized protein n=1 Tax=Filimonas lacunae TaxID=477680 RepID=A0A1N7L8S3_9BACT|nr:hypothetical protein [Filimonas lacunae]SIS70207.1 hypothetical protein SAMN05421788_101712 [Filimonas lacunae]
MLPGVSNDLGYTPILTKNGAEKEKIACLAAYIPKNDKKGREKREKATTTYNSCFRPAFK